MLKMLFVLFFSILVAVPVFAVENTGTITGEVKVFRARRSADVVVYLADIPGVFKPLENHPVMDQKNLVFIPHVLPVLVGSIVDFANSDNVKHNVYSQSKTKKFNLGTYGNDVVKQVTFDKDGEVGLACNVHAEMSASIIALSNPYFAKTGNDGRFTISNIPPGQYLLKTWHERKRPYEQKITVKAGKTTEINIDLKR